MKAGNFTATEPFDESGWSSDSLAYDGTLKHSPSGTEWDAGIWVHFDWRKPEAVEIMSIDLIHYRKPGEEWSSSPMELSFDLTADEGIKADGQIQEVMKT